MAESLRRHPVMTPRILALRNVPFERLGLFASLLRDAGLAYRYLDVYRDAGGPAELRSVLGLIILGGPMSANDDLPQIRRALRLIEDALAAEIPILGICLGAQLLAKALGARVYRNAVKEIGWMPVYLTDAAGRDPLLAGWSPEETVFHWHGETFDLPRGAIWLARSDACRHQAFRFGSLFYGFQFHIEVTAPMIRDWLVQDANRADVSGLTGPIDPKANAGRLKELAAMTVPRWCDLVKR